MARKRITKYQAGGLLPEVVVTDTAPRWLTYSRQFEEKFPKSKFIKGYLDPLARSIGNTEDSYPASVDERYEKKRQNFIAQNLLDNTGFKTKSKEDRLNLYDSFSNREREIIQGSSHANKFLPAERENDIRTSDSVRDYLLHQYTPDVIAASVQGTPHRGRLFPNLRSSAEDFVNPLIWIGEGAKSVGEAVKPAMEGDIGPMAVAIGENLLLGAMGFDPLSFTGNTIENRAIPEFHKLLRSSDKLLQNTKTASQKLADSVLDFKAGYSTSNDIRNFAAKANQKLKALPKEKFKQLREVQALSALTMEEGITREALVNRYLKSSLNDDFLKKLTGSTRQELEEELRYPGQMLKNGVPKDGTPPLQETPGVEIREISQDAPMDPLNLDYSIPPSSTRAQERLLSPDEIGLRPRIHGTIALPDISPSELWPEPTAVVGGRTPDEIIRIAREMANRDALENFNAPTFSRTSRRVSLDEYNELVDDNQWQNIDYFNPSALRLEERRLFSQTDNPAYKFGKKTAELLGKGKISNKLVPYSPIEKGTNVKHALGLLYKDHGQSTKSIISQVNEAFKAVKEGDKGLYKASSSLSDNSAPLFFKKAAALSGQKDIEFSVDGYFRLNNSGFLEQKNIAKKDIKDFLNTHIQDLEFNGKKLPPAYVDGNTIMIPNLIIKKYAEGGIVTEESLATYQQGAYVVTDSGAHTKMQPAGNPMGAFPIPDADKYNLPKKMMIPSLQTMDEDYIPVYLQDLYKIDKELGQPHLEKVYSDEDRELDYKNALRLTQGRYNTGKLPKGIVDEVVKVSKEEGIDPYDLLAVMGRESTFKSPMMYNARTGKGLANKTMLVSGWNLANKYIYDDPMTFLAKKNVPGIKYEKSKHGYDYEITDEEAIQNYIARNPKVVKEYEKHVKSVKPPDYGEAYDAYREVARMIKLNEMGKYNPGDRDYTRKLANEKKLLLAEPKLSQYMLSKGYTENKFQKGGRVKDNIDFELMNMDKFNTKLTDEEEAQFWSWAENKIGSYDNIMAEMGAYDVKGAWKGLMKGDFQDDDPRGHFPDTYKKPNHPTFSNESKYSSVLHKGGDWGYKNGSDIFTPSGYMLRNYGEEYTRRYLNDADPGVKLTLKRRK